jgi:hypothetical protein
MVGTGLVEPLEHAREVFLLLHDQLLVGGLQFWVLTI